MQRCLKSETKTENKAGSIQIQLGNKAVEIWKQNQIDLSMFFCLKYGESIIESSHSRVVFKKFAEVSGMNKCLVSSFQ